MAKILIMIADGGKTEIEVHGHSGPSCQSLTAAIEESLGEVASDRKLPEYFQQSKQGQQATVGAK